MFLVYENPVGDLLNNTEWAFPMAECFHIVAFAFSIGTIALVDLRMLGLGIRKQTAAQIEKNLAPYTIIGLAVVILAGMALFLSDPRHYYYNESFRFKIIALLVAIVYNYTIHHKVAKDGSPGAGKIVAVVSLVLWVSIVFSGIFIAFV